MRGQVGGWIVGWLGGWSAGDYLEEFSGSGAHLPPGHGKPSSNCIRMDLNTIQGCDYLSVRRQSHPSASLRTTSRTESLFVLEGRAQKCMLFASVSSLVMVWEGFG